MRLTTKSRYGARAIFDIAYNSAGMPVQIKDISNRQAIPPRYLEQIFHKFKKAGIVKSVRGPGGGYVLANDPRKITIGDVIRAIKEPIAPVFCVDSKDGHHSGCSREKLCATRQVWEEAGEKITEYFDSITIGELCERARGIGITKDVKHAFDYSI